MISRRGAWLITGSEMRRLENEICIRTEDLRLSTERYTRLVRGLPDIIFETTPLGRILVVSMSVMEILGYKPADLIDRTWNERVHPEDQVAFSQAWEQSSREADFSIPALRYLNSQGQIRYLTLFFMPVFGEPDRLEGWNGWPGTLPGEIRTNRRVRELTHQLIQGQEEERRRLALDLHDEMGQVLSALKIGLQSLVGEGRDPENLYRDEVLELIELSQAIMDRIRALAYSLHPAILENFGLVAAIEDLCESSADASGLEITFKTTESGIEELTREVKTTLFRFVQEV